CRRTYMTNWGRCGINYWTGARVRCLRQGMISNLLSNLISNPLKKERARLLGQTLLSRLRLSMKSHGLQQRRFTLTCATYSGLMTTDTRLSNGVRADISPR